MQETTQGSAADASAETCMMEQPKPQHHWLKKFVGEWTYTGHCVMGPDTEPMTFEGTETVRALGDLWIIGESKSAMPGGEPATMITTIGFNPKTGRFPGTWIGSMATHLWIYDGHLDAAERVLTLETVGITPMNPDKTTVFKDITEFVSNDERKFHTMMKKEDGTWYQLVSMTFKRKK